jgi:hypothetical protein
MKRSAGRLRGVTLRTQWRMAVAALAVGVLLGPVAKEETIATAAVRCCDFNGDGKSDLLWQSSTTGQVELWLLDGAKLVSDMAAGPTVALATGWQIWGVSADGVAETVQENPAPWERKIGAVYENKGIAKIERVAVHYVLTTYCHGIHSIYVKGGTEVKLDDYKGKFVQARYKYIEEINTNIQCITAPCEPVVEKIALIVELSAVEVSEAELMNYQTSCSNLVPTNR